MKKNFAIIGGDLRNIKIAKMLAEDGNKVYIYGLESEELRNNKNITNCDNLNKTFQETEIIVGPIPFSNDGIEINAKFSNEKILIKDIFENMNNQILIAGSITSEIYNIAKERNIEIIDIMKREELAILNAIATAEGTIKIIIENTEKIVHLSNILILGFGRIGKILAKKLEGLSAKVTCAARKKEDLAWIKSYGYKPIDINDLNENLAEYDCIINTVPHLILTKEKLKYVKKDSLLIDLASKPGGVDREEAEKRKLKFIWALALPGKVAPVTTADFIKNTIYNVLNETNEKI